MATYNQQLISGLDDLLYDVTLTDPLTGLPVTSGVVEMVLCQLGTTTRLGPNSGVFLTHQGNGRWTGVADAAVFAPDLPSVGSLFDRVIFVDDSTTGRLLARCRRVSMVEDATLRLVKQYLRLQTDAEDLLLLSLINSATAVVEAWIGRPIEVRPMTFTDEGRDALGGPSKTLRISVTPIASLTSIVDEKGDALTLADYRLNSQTGIIVAKDHTPFMHGPYTITAVVGLSTTTEYTLGASSVLQQAVVDTVADLYQRRNPVAMREAEGGGIAVDYADQKRGVGADNAREDLLPARVTAMLAPFRMLGVA